MLRNTVTVVAASSYIIRLIVLYIKCAQIQVEKARIKQAWYYLGSSTLRRRCQEGCSQSLNSNVVVSSNVKKVLLSEAQIRGQ